MTHLTPKSLDALLEGTLSRAEARALSAHLAAGCPTCEELAGGLEIEVLARLLAAAGAAEVAPEAAERERMWRRIAPRRRLLPAAALALAAAAAAALLLGRPDGWEGVKGEAGPPAVELRAVTASWEGERLVPGGRVVDGDALPVGTTLLFEVETDRAAARYLWVEDAAGARTWLAPSGPPAVAPPGRRQVADERGLVALELEPGPVVIVAAAAAEALAPEVAAGRPREVGAVELRVEGTR